MLCEHADFKALSLKDIHTASDGTRKVEINLSNLSVVLMGVACTLL